MFVAGISTVLKPMLVSAFPLGRHFNNVGSGSVGLINHFPWLELPSSTTLKYLEATQAMAWYNVFD